MEKKKTAIIYARVSTVRQAKDELPIDGQVERDRAKAVALEATVTRVFIDEGVSGRKENRREFQNAIAYCEAFDIDYFIVWDSWRLSRSKIHAARYKERLQLGGTKVVYASTDIDIETDEGWLYDSIGEVMGEHYSRMIARDTRRSMMKNAKDGYFNGGVSPYGYDAVQDGKRKRLQLNEAEAPIVRKIFAMYLAGDGSKTIAMLLNREGLYRRGSVWGKATIIWLLKNFAYLGYVVFNRAGPDRKQRPEDCWVKTKAHPAIIDEKDFLKVQSMLRKKSPLSDAGSPHSNFLFTGLLRCGRCGQGLQTESARGRSKRYHYYNCRSAQKGYGCVNRRLPAGDFDMWLASEVMDRLLTQERVRELAAQFHEDSKQWAKEREERRSALVAELRSCERKRSNLYGVLELHGRDAPNLGDLTIRLRELNEQVKTIETTLGQLEEVGPQPAMIGEAQLDELALFVRELIETSEAPKKVRAFLGSFIQRIVVNDSDVIVEYDPDRLMGGGAIAVHSEVRWLPDLVLLRTEKLGLGLPDRFKKAA